MYCGLYTFLFIQGSGQLALKWIISGSGFTQTKKYIYWGSGARGQIYFGSYSIKGGHLTMRYASFALATSVRNTDSKTNKQKQLVSGQAARDWSFPNKLIFYRNHSKRLSESDLKLVWLVGKFPQKKNPYSVSCNS